MSLFLQEGGGSSLDQLVIIYVVIIGLRREGAKPNLQFFTKYAVVFFEGATKGLVRVRGRSDDGQVVR